MKHLEDLEPFELVQTNNLITIYLGQAVSEGEMEFSHWRVEAGDHLVINRYAAHEAEWCSDAYEEGSEEEFHEFEKGGTP